MYTRNFKRMVRLTQVLFLVLFGSGLYIYHHFEEEQHESYRYLVAKNRNHDQISSNRNSIHDSDYVSANSTHFMVQKDQRKKQPLNRKNNLYDRLGQGVKVPSRSGKSHGGRDGKNHLAYRGKESETPHRSKKTTNDIENKEQEKSLCNIPFEYGQMCPTLYTDLGGFCERVEAAPQGFDCPDIRTKGYNNLRSTQLVLTRLLKIFDLVARKHGIKYWITSGTLLGAARHRGFIPWDEDADIEMTLANYIKLFKCCKNAEFPGGVFFQNSETDPYLKSWNETENRLDRHPVVGLYKRLWNPRLRDTKSCTRYCLTYDCKWVDGLMVDIFIAEDTLHPEHLRKVFPLKEMLFEGFRFPVPSNWKDILQYKYGNYESELGESNDRIPQDNSDPFHSCEELKQAKKRKKDSD